MVIPTMPSSVRKPMASNKPVYLTTRRAEIGIVQSTQQMTLPQAVVHLDVTAAEQIILILARLCGGRRLISYNPAMLNQHRQIEIYLGKVIHGALPADLPIQQPWRPHPPGHNSKPNLERLGYFRKRPRRSTENQRGHCKAIHYPSPRAGCGFCLAVSIIHMRRILAASRVVATPDLTLFSCKCTVHFQQSG